MRRILIPLLTVLLLAGLGYAIWASVGGQLAARRVLTVRGLIGSEKEDFFRDPDVQAALKKLGLSVQVEKAGSRQIATGYDLSKYDFAFPAGVAAAEKIRRERKVTQTYDAFYTPMAVASWKPIARILEANGLAVNQGGVERLRLDKLLPVMEAGKRWKDLKGAASYPVGRSVLISSTDVTKSNSAAMYLALASYALNGDRVVQGGEAQALLPKLAPLFLRQGYQENSSEGPFEDYLALGMGKAPMVMVYESQFVEQAAKKALTPDMLLMYPTPTVFTKHVLVPFSDGGRRLGEALADPSLQQLEVRYGFRTRDPRLFADFVKQGGLELPNSLVDVIDPPTYEVTEGLIRAIEQAGK